MSIPLDHLYHHLETLCGEDVIIYRWDPHGSKNLKNLTPIRYFNIEQRLTMPGIVAHDQEPLDYEYFESQDSMREQFPEWKSYENHNKYVETISKLRIQTDIWNVHDKVLLCHSEKNSAELDKFSSDFIGVYYWSHAVIARDWFRFAEHDISLINCPSNYTRDFLIYNRAWSGTREYRLKFVELMINAGLVDCSNIKFSKIDSGLHYTEHRFNNSKFKITDYSIENKILPNTFNSTASADYVANDYNTCGIEVVLETLFDDARNHLTEKALRPIACGKPFILVSTPGSLQYLKDYGFKTFAGLINESYDQIQDPVQRLTAIIDEMRRINHLPEDAKHKLFQELNQIAKYNQALFFSRAWHDQIINEFKTNADHALQLAKTYRRATTWARLKSILIDNPPMYQDFRQEFGDDILALFESLSSKVKHS